MRIRTKGMNKEMKRDKDFVTFSFHGSLPTFCSSHTHKNVHLLVQTLD